MAWLENRRGSRGDLCRSAPEHSFFQQLERISADDIARYQQLLQRLQSRAEADVSEAEAHAIVRLSLHYIEPRYRFGVLTREIMDAVVAVRDEFYANLPKQLRDRIERYDPHRYMSAGDAA